MKQRLNPSSSNHFVIAHFKKYILYKYILYYIASEVIEMTESI